MSNTIWYPFKPFIKKALSVIYGASQIERNLHLACVVDLGDFGSDSKIIVIWLAFHYAQMYI